MTDPAHTPPPRPAEKLAEIAPLLAPIIAKVAADPEMIEQFKPQGVEIRASSQAEFKDFMNREEVRWVKLIKSRNIKPE